MNLCLIASPPALVFYCGMVVGVMIAAGLVAAFLLPATRPDWRKTLRICLTALICGPAMGAAVACLMLVFGNVDALDRIHLLVSSTSLGTFAGAVTCFAVSAVTLAKSYNSRSRPPSSDPQAKPNGR